MLLNNVQLLTVLPVPDLTDIMSLSSLEKGKDASRNADHLADGGGRRPYKYDNRT